MEEIVYRCFPIENGFITNNFVYYKIKEYMAEAGESTNELLYKVSRKRVGNKYFSYIEVELFSKVLKLGESKRKKDWQKMDKYRSKVISMRLLEDYKINAVILNMSAPEYLKSISANESYESLEYLFCFCDTMQIWEKNMFDKYRSYCESYKNSLEAMLKSNNPQE